jgi:glutaredoxin-like protein
MGESLLSKEVTDQLREVFAGLEHPVEVLVFNRKDDCQFCTDNSQLVKEVIALSDKLGMREYDLDEDKEIVQAYKVDKAPGLVITAKDGDVLTDYGIRFAGIPSGHEFSSLIHDLLLVSRRDSGLEKQTRDVLSKLEKPIHLQVFVTPT